MRLNLGTRCCCKEGGEVRSRETDRPPATTKGRIRVRMREEMEGGRGETSGRAGEEGTKAHIRTVAATVVTRTARESHDRKKIRDNTIEASIVTDAKRFPLLLALFDR